MKKIPLFAFAIASLVFASSCSKNSPNDNNPPAPEQKWRILTYRSVNTVDSSDFTFQYDGDGRITGVVQKYNQQPPALGLKIEYPGGAIKMTSVGAGALTVQDTIFVFSGSNNKKAKRVAHTIFLPQAPGTFTTNRRDTSDYEYDASGLLLKETIHHRDSVSWPNGDWAVSTAVKIVNYNNSNGNLVLVTELDHDTSRSFISSVSKTTITSVEITDNFSYTKQYLNKTDFTNQDVLNEFRIFTQYTMDRGYSMLPDSINHSEVHKDQNGAVTSTINQSYLYDYTYDSTGLIVGGVSGIPGNYPIGHNTFSYGTP